MTHTLSETALDQLFLTARTYNGWQDRDVPDALLTQLHDLMRMGPTSANCCPLRIRFLKSAAAKQRLKPFLMDGNVDKTMSAPVVAILGYDTEFYEHLPKLFPHTDARSWFVGKEKFAQETAFRNSSLQGGYFIMAARALGLDCGPMSGFNASKVNDEFFPDGTVKVNFLCNLGYGDPASLHPRAPRFEFDDVCEIL